MLIEGGYVVTNAEVVWPFETVSIVFPDGSEFLEVSVKGLDFISDLAVLGPIDSPTIGVRVGRQRDDSEEGASMYTWSGTQGQPAEVDQPLVESRLILGASDFGSSGITFMHTEAKFSGPAALSASRYSGWVVVSERWRGCWRPRTPAGGNPIRSLRIISRYLAAGATAHRRRGSVQTG